MEKTIQFDFESDIPFDVDFEKISLWINAVSKEETKSIESLSYIICSDEFLLQINKEHLNHDYYTDIITFPYQYDPIESDVYISIDRVIDNANGFDEDPLRELSRVIIHGLLHMCGYNDHTEEEKGLMRKKENYYLEKLGL